MRKVRIKNDGLPAYMTEVTDADSGQSIDCVQRIDLVIDVTEPSNRRAMPYATMLVGFPVVDIIADADIKHVCPVCGKPTADEAE